MTMLYKYRKWDKYTRKILTNSELYFSLPKDFNDPLDCRIRLCLDGTFDQYKQHFLRHQRHFIDSWRKEIGNSSKEQISQEIIQILKDVYQLPTFKEGIAQQHIEMIRSNFGICCFSSNKLNTLMWSHYADSHRGICLEFEGGGRFFGAALPVVYEKEVPITSFFEPIDNQVKTCLLTKSRDWAYEDEFRIVLPGKSGSISYPPDLLKGIIFGCQISKEDKEEIMDLVKISKTKIRLYQAVLQDRTFEIVIVPIANV